MIIVIAGFVAAFLVFGSLQIVVRVILILQDMSEPQNDDLVSQEERDATFSIKWLFTYTRFLIACLSELLRIRIRQAFLRRQITPRKRLEIRKQHAENQGRL